jgi:CheY-like chemotaxis protein
MSQADAVAKRTAYIADDDPGSRLLLSKALTDSGFKVVGEAGDGQAALADVKRLLPDVVCLDIDMPKMSGLDVMARLRGLNDKMVALIVTATPTAQNVREAIQVRADGVLAKPFTAEKITAEISRASARKLLKR